MDTTTGARRREAAPGLRLRMKKSQPGPTQASRASSAAYLRPASYHAPSTRSFGSASSTDDSLEDELAMAPSSYTTAEFLPRASTPGRPPENGTAGLRKGLGAESIATAPAKMLSQSPRPRSAAAAAARGIASSPFSGPYRPRRSPLRPSARDEPAPPTSQIARRPSPDPELRPSEDSRASSPLSEPDPDIDLDLEASSGLPGLSLPGRLESEQGEAVPGNHESSDLTSLPPATSDAMDDAVEEGADFPEDSQPDGQMSWCPDEDETQGSPERWLGGGLSQRMAARSSDRMTIAVGSSIQDEEDLSQLDSIKVESAPEDYADATKDHVEKISGISGDPGLGPDAHVRRHQSPALSLLHPDAMDYSPVPIQQTAALLPETGPLAHLQLSQPTTMPSTLITRQGIPTPTYSQPHPLNLRTRLVGDLLDASSELSPLRSSEAPSAASSRVTGSGTPISVDNDAQSQQPAPLKSAVMRHDFGVRSKSSIPPTLSPSEYATKCIEAAETSRLNPFALHPEEYLLFRNHISHSQVTTYLNVRNGILRLWLLSPQVPLSREKAVGCAHSRWFDVASVCYDWLARRGYINYGCVRIPAPPAPPETRKQRTVVVIGAGFSGLGCARQLEGLFRQYADAFGSRGEVPPKVVVLEGRSRVGGRVYSRAFTRKSSTASSFPGQRHCAEMGGMIITGFDRGNPLNVLVRGQLALPYHPLNPEMTLYDVDGAPVNASRDHLVEKLYNDCLDRVSEYKFKMRPEKLITGSTTLIEDGKDGATECHKTISQAEKERAAQPDQPPESEQNIADQVKLVPVSADRVTGQIHTQPGNPAAATAAERAQSFGWTLKAGVTEKDNIDLGAASKAPGATLGSVLDDVISQCRKIVDLGPLDFRLLNWHIANLEYSNATTLSNLSLGGWDIDAGNEWEGAHSMIVGGYQNVARGLLLCPEPLDVRPRAAVAKIEYTSDRGVGPAVVTTVDGSTVEADCVVSTIPLGVMKAETVSYDPPLPSWKSDAVARLGFGILNKVVLVYEKPFWDDSQDIFGVLRSPVKKGSLKQEDYTSQRGRFFQWFNISKPCGLPCLLALMAGDAGFETERTDNEELVKEATQVLRSVFGGPARVPYPVEAIVTRWGSDPFARGSYSSCGPEMQQDDYDTLARPLGNLFFAGEHTIGTHPATVHGAYLSGLRAASEVLEAMIGPIEVPTPILRPRDFAQPRGPPKRKQPAETASSSPAERYETQVLQYIASRIGERPTPPPKVKCTPFDAFKMANLELAQKKCQEESAAAESADGRPASQDVHAMLAQMWDAIDEQERRQHEASSQAQLEAYSAAVQRYQEESAKWDSDAVKIRMIYEKAHPPLAGPDDLDYQLRLKSRRVKRVGTARAGEAVDSV